MVEESYERNWFATVPIAMEGLLADEIRNLGGKNVKESLAGVSFKGDLETAYRVILWSRLASRVVLPLARFSAGSREELYQKVYKLNWSLHLTEELTFMIRGSAKGSNLHHSEFVSRVTKDAIVDQFREKTGSRPSVDRENPDVVFHCRIVNNQADLGVELASGVLHRRGYRTTQGMAPLRENVAAAMLIRAGWPDKFDEDVGFMDPLCGSGTIVIEAAMMAADIAPGIIPGSAGLNNWLGHDPDIWTELFDEAERRRKIGLKQKHVILGFDRDERIVEVARTNAARAQIEHSVEFTVSDLKNVRPGTDIKSGLIVVNPPYGKRLAAPDGSEAIYRELGKLWFEHFQGWKSMLITDEKTNARAVGLRASKMNSIYNGGIQCVLAQFDISAENELREYTAGAGKDHGLAPRMRSRPAEAQAFANRLRKNRRKLKSWLKQKGITCYRIYDADMPNFSMAIDVYENKWVVVQEYAPPTSVDPVKANDRVHEALEIIPEELGILRENLFLKQRKRHSYTSQYGKMGEKGRFEEVSENGLNFLVNFTDYLDTGIFLDHRPLREKIRQMSHGKRFLNLFAYTGTATVYAISGGARFTRTIDSSNTYLGWTEANFRRNNIDPDKHSLVRGDCMEWLLQDSDQYDLIFCDPPTHSVSKDRETFDVQKDHVRLILRVSRRLAPGGTILFSTNFRKFRMDEQLLLDFNVKNITRETIPRDFSRNQRIHSCWQINVSE
ncbi:bifunctional 23S rRNA (guanine(2069)-N(7))-methyltransferase RlmK/23S rRNA (guanine(2445)-N(2))-methyltransferase RlmL [bacterium]|nr:bifunctional 23S rRNA (guanine(2069)-N(7))-methyltransferase RlmK/23S rRNA (guanine(2445)-N(2))-methyltransferase RlmL [bacterium]